ncbi:MAG TPA: pyridoxal phosphate-dependent aminotransferase [Candidatus Angelobacter sp.]|nr:pyridoxal phosphate-dependent aminotransferase [Candidatus Angelobacter sp.]
MFASRTNWDLETNRLADALARHRSSGRKLFDLAASNPTEYGFHYDAPAIVRALCNPSAMQYHPEPRGLLSARKAVSEYYAARKDQVSHESLFLTVSTSEAYSYVFRLLCNPGDELLIPTPGYPLFDFLAEVNDVKLSRYPLFYDHGWHIDLHALEQAITPQTRGVIVVHPNNPTGHYTKPAEIARLNQICSANKMAVIADEVFLDFSLIGTTQPSFIANQDTLTFTLSGISKISGLPQMKLAWLAVSGPDNLKREALARLELIADTYLSMNAPIQLAAPILLQQRTNFQRQLMARVKTNLSGLDSQLTGQSQVSRLEIESGWYAVLRVPATRSDEDLSIDLLEKHNVYVHPGHFYEFPGDGYLVVSLITSEQEFAEGISRILTAF